MKKRCNKCGLDKDLTEFTKDKRIVDGHMNTCKVCANKYQREKRWEMYGKPMGRSWKQTAEERQKEYEKGKEE